MKERFMPAYEKLYSDLKRLRRSENLPDEFDMLRALKQTEKYDCVHKYEASSHGTDDLYGGVFEEASNDNVKMDCFLESIFSHSESKSIKLYRLDKLLFLIKR